MPPLQRQIGKAMDYQFELLENEEADEVGYLIQGSYESAYSTYGHLLSLGVSREDARSVLPLGTQTHLIASSHLKGWFRFLAQRTDPHAQDEIRGIATEIERQLRTAFPVSLAAWDTEGRRPL